MPTAMAMNTANPAAATNTNVAIEQPAAAVMNIAAGPNSAVATNASEAVQQPNVGVANRNAVATSTNETVQQPAAVAMGSDVTLSTGAATNTNDATERALQRTVDHAVSFNTHVAIQQAAGIQLTATTNSSENPARRLVSVHGSISGSGTSLARDSGPDESATSLNNRDSGPDESGSEQDNSSPFRSTAV